MKKIVVSTELAIDLQQYVVKIASSRSSNELQVKALVDTTNFAITEVLDKSVQLGTTQDVF